MVIRGRRTCAAAAAAVVVEEQLLGIFLRVSSSGNSFRSVGVFCSVDGVGSVILTISYS
jgi:hypothetical protein